jgi:hypothetical protein
MKSFPQTPNRYRQDFQQRQPQPPYVRPSPPVPAPDDEPDIKPALEAELPRGETAADDIEHDEPVTTEETLPPENPWKPIGEAPKDRIVEGRFSAGEEVGRPIRWRNSRKRTGPYEWSDWGVWHAAETRGAVQLHPIEWREWMPAGIHFPAVAEAK